MDELNRADANGLMESPADEDLSHLSEELRVP